jgi:hypothetical protein
LYEGDDATQDVVDVFSDSSVQLARPAKRSDEARLLVLAGVRRGCLIWLYDRNPPSRDSAWCRIAVLEPHPWWIVGSFDKAYTDTYVKVTVKPERGKDKVKVSGKVSHVHVMAWDINPGDQP